MDLTLDINRIEQLLDRRLTQDEVDEYQYWRKGRSVAEIEKTEGFAIILESLGQEVDEANAALAAPLPHAEDLRAAHSQFYAANTLYQKIRQNLMLMIQRSSQTPDFVKQAFRQVSPT